MVMKLEYGTMFPSLFLAKRLKMSSGSMRYSGDAWSMTLYIWPKRMKLDE